MHLVGDFKLNDQNIFSHSSYWQIFNFQINNILSQTLKSNDWLLSLGNSYLERIDH